VAIRVHTLGASGCQVLLTRAGTNSARARPGLLLMRSSPSKSCGARGLITVRANSASVSVTPVKRATGRLDPPIYGKVAVGSFTGHPFRTLVDLVAGCPIRPREHRGRQAQPVKTSSRLLPCMSMHGLTSGQTSGSVAAEPLDR
jgi:hypothetical protein